MLDRIFYSLCSLTITSSFIILLIFILSPLLYKHYNGDWKKCLWILLLLRLLFPFHFSFAPALIHIPSINLSISTDDWSMPVTIFLISVWICGVLIYAEIQRLNFQHFYKEIMEHSEKAEDSAALILFYKVKKEMGIKKSVSLYFCKQLNTPIVLGIIKPIMLLPSQEFSEEELLSIYRHEFTHLKNHDGCFKLFTACIATLYWFHPLIHIMVKQTYNEIELTCDKKVTKDMNSSQKAQYVHTILSFISSKKINNSAGLNRFLSEKNSLKHRISNIFDTNRKKSGYGIALLLFLLFMTCDVLISWTPLPTAPQNTINSLESKSELSASNSDKEETETTKKRLTDDYVHPYNNLEADKQLCSRAKDYLLSSLSPDETTEVRDKVSRMHWWIDNTLLHWGENRSSSSLAWNMIDYDASSFDTESFRIARDEYTGVEYLQDLTDIKSIIHDPYFSEDIEKEIHLMEDAIATHDIEKLYELHQIAHDLDYWLINYPVGTFRAAPADWHGIYVYFGVLHAYKCVEDVNH